MSPAQPRVICSGDDESRAEGSSSQKECMTQFLDCVIVVCDDKRTRCSLLKRKRKVSDAVNFCNYRFLRPVR